MARRAILALILGITLAGRAMGFDLSFPSLQSDTESSALTLFCNGESDQEITCQGYSVFVKGPDLARIETQKAESLRDISKELAPEVLKRSCPEPEFFKTPPKKPDNSGAEEFLRAYELLCTERSEAAAKALLEVASRNEASTCKISAVPVGPVTLYKVNETTWANRPEPWGVCNVITSMILEVDEKHKLLGTWRQTRTYSDKDSEFCKAVETGRTVVWSWNSKRTFELGCKFIEYGL